MKIIYNPETRKFAYSEEIQDKISTLERTRDREISVIDTRISRLDSEISNLKSKMERLKSDKSKELAKLSEVKQTYRDRIQEAKSDSKIQ